MAGAAFLGATFQVMLDRLASPELIDFFRGRKHDEKLLNELNLKLLELKMVLDDAENKQIINKDVKHWLDQVKDAVYHAEDLVDEIGTAALRCKVEAEYQSGTNQVQALISTITKLFDDKIQSKLRTMICKLDTLVKAKHVLGLSIVAGQNWSPRLPTDSLVDDSCVYGRENNREEIMKLLLSDGESSNKIDVIPIAGMGGVGKTTLAQLLYNDDRLSGHFVKKAWVCVSDVFDVSSVRITLVQAFTGRACDTKDPNLLVAKLKESLLGKKFLIVLDDVWNENYDNWNALMTPFKFGERGSKIIVTTRNDDVASIMKTGVPIHKLHKLPEQDCWELFSQHAFENGDSNEHPNLVRIGKEIVRKCDGLPLAVKTLGGLLRSQRDVKDWNNILESAIWELPEEKSNILAALRLSYHYLPSHLKRCFAFCSIFIKDYEFDMKELVSIWKAEGLLVKRIKNSKTVEEEGYECFRQLLSRSFFQRSNMNNSLFVMHDLVHDLAQYMMGDFYYRLEDDKRYSVAEKVRHFSFVRRTFHGFEEFKEITKANCLRTFLPLKRRGYVGDWLSKKFVDEILPRLTRLRLLSLSRYRIKELPHSIGDLMHLRFLDLSHSLIRELPDSVGTLYNLETLLLSNCNLLKTLPANLIKLISLRNLDLSGTNLKEMPMHISRLKDLRELTVFVVGTCTGINELGEFRCLRGTISILGLQNVKSGINALEAKMSEKKYLEKLALEWDSTPNDSQIARDVLDFLKPHTNLKHLEIKNYGGEKFPKWLGDRSFCNMVSLRLEDCKNCISLPPLGQIPFLKELIIARMPRIRDVGRDFYYGESSSLCKPFESLETLRFEQMSEWVDWCILNAGEFSRLQKLEVIKCPKLIGHLPTNVPFLVRLKIMDCPELVASLPNTTSIRELALSKCQGMQLQWQGVSTVEKLEISGFASLREFPSELVTLTNLKELSVDQCPSLYVPLSDGMSQCDIFFLLFCLGNKSQCNMLLERLTLGGCQSLKSIPLGLFPKLRSLEIRDCEKFETLLIPDGIELQNPTLLESLSIVNCNNMLSFPCGGLPASNLSDLELSHCEKLKALPEQMHTLLPSLQSLSLEDCPEIESFLEGGLPSKLSRLYIIKCQKLKTLPEQMHTLLPSLQSLELSKCPEIESFPEGGLPSKLVHLYIWNCKKLVGGRRDWGLQTLPSLTSFILGGESEDVLESFPEEGLLPSALTSLRFGGMQNLKSLNKRGLQLLVSLEGMHILKCPQLQSLPEEGLPTSLLELTIRECPLLKPRCRREEGEDWHKIAHIPFTKIDEEVISD